ncbi:DotA/TraY family protein [Undibacterium umbellatum]|uniref:DotA/TraY family protein n=1 Tax=Undibacterium umbellatum TaxID=2762300 RepID=A0ABR6ZGD0_9BURK|nr:DotA/TraY family protein [Undibacterium umbellatum]MBC3910785.1 DotA/TraY family protein [Undibacterium umbellatum]
MSEYKPVFAQQLSEIKEIPMRTSKKLSIFILLTLAITLMATGAHAGNFWVPTQGHGDYSIQMLKFIFGDVVLKIYDGTIADNNNHILSSLLAKMNAGVLVIGMIIMAYTYIGGAVHTAKDGEWLGKKWDTMMVPLRTAAGMAMLLPTVAGYSFLQVVLIWSGIQAVGLGSTIWTTAYTSISKQVFTTPPFLAPNKTAKQVFLMVACKQAGDMYGMTITPSSSDGKMIYAAAGSQDAGSAGFCGSIQWSASSTFTKLQNASTSLIGCDNLFSNQVGCTKLLSDATAQPFSSFNVAGVDGVELFQPTDRKKFEDAMRIEHGKIIVDMLNSPVLIEMANELLLSTDSSKRSMLPGGKYQNTLATIQLQYEKDLVKKIQDHMKATLFQGQSPQALWITKMAAQMEAGGWLHAGSFYMKIGNLNNAAQSVINGAISTAYTIPNISGMQNDSQNSAFSVFLNNIQQAVIGTNDLSTKIESNTPAKFDFLDIRKTWNGITDGISTGILKFAMVGEIGKNGMDPLIQLKSIGDTAIVAGELMLVEGSGALPSKDKSADTSTFSIILAALTGLMLSLGMFLGIILPMLPYVFWVAGVAWWLISFVEAVIAAPIWAIAHMHPEGHDVAGRGSPGYMFVLSILIRPALMVIFLFAAMLLIKPIMNFVNQGFFQSISNMTEGSMVGIMTLLGTLILYSGITTKMITTVFGIINTGPDNILRWIGGNSAVGTQAQSTASSIHQGVDAAGGQAAGAVGNVVKGIGGKMAAKRGSVVSSAQ